ncbi:MAG: esterase-like activity of phytase family protein [Gemmatimonadota bacterium]|nr:esterase-like activity of phytase family protein [Gemmatimonadota bacterium]
MKSSLLLLLAASAISLSCKTDQVLVAPATTFPAKAVDAAPTAWGSLSGVSISGGYGSAVMVDPRDPNSFYVMTDRGANVGTSVAGQLLFPIPSFNPNIAKYTLSGDSLRRVSVINLKNAAGINLTGIPNPAGVGGTNETAVGPGGVSLALDPEGIDPEGLAIAPDGSFWVSDEYGPHIIHFDATGRTLERMNPFGTGAGGRRLPAVLGKRRPNRGMEGLALTIDGKTLVGAMQSPLDNPTTALGRASNAHRILTVDVATGATKQYVYVSDAVGTLISEITAINSTEFLVIERDGNFSGGTPAAVHKKVYKISLSGATDVSDAADAAGGKVFTGKVLEALTPAERTAAGITPVTKTLVLDLLTLPGGYPHDKLEGVTLVGSDMLVLANDDDFGVIDAGAAAIAPKLLPSGSRDRLTLYFVKLAAPLR